MGSDDVQARNAATQAGARLLAGTPYRYVAPLGRGGMGEVIEAEHVALGKRVVVKLLHAQFADRVDLVDRMRVEAQALARLAHPNLVVVNDFGQTGDGRTYLVMERLWGRTLRDELRGRGALPPLEAIEYVRQALGGLAAAHDAGVVHRDVKLDNIFLCDAPAGSGDAAGRRVIKLLDFGIAKVIGGDQRAPAPLAYPTEEGIAVGTPRFFSPEQARGQRVDGRTDVYATGIVLYTLLAGRGPFDHISALFELTRAHAMEKPAPPSEYARQRIAPSLERAIMRALEKKPEDRFPSAAIFSTELAKIAAELQSEQAAVEARPTVRMPELAEQHEVERKMRDPRASAPAAMLAPAPVAAADSDELPTAPRAYGSPSPRPVQRASGVLVPMVVIASALVSAALVVVVLMYALR